MEASELTLREVLNHIFTKHPNLALDVPIHVALTEQTSIRYKGNFSYSDYSACLFSAFQKALALDHCLPDWIIQEQGMSGRKYRYFINNLIKSLKNPRYLEIGCWTGSTAISAMFDNKLDIVCIDNWSQYGGPKDRFIENVNKVKTTDSNFRLIEQDFRSVDFEALALDANVYLFDGPHSEQDQYDGIRYVLPSLQSDFVLIVDDFNLPDVRNGTARAIAESALSIEACIEITTTTNNTHPRIGLSQSDWHNGYCIAFVRKATPHPL